MTMRQRSQAWSRVLLSLGFVLLAACGAAEPATPSPGPSTAPVPATTPPPAPSPIRAAAGTAVPVPTLGVLSVSGFAEWRANQPPSGHRWLTLSVTVEATENDWPLAPNQLRLRDRAMQGASTALPEGASPLLAMPALVARGQSVAGRITFLVLKAASDFYLEVRPPAGASTVLVELGQPADPDLDGVRAAYLALMATYNARLAEIGKLADAAGCDPTKLGTAHHASVAAVETFASSLRAISFPDGFGPAVSELLFWSGEVVTRERTLAGQPLSSGVGQTVATAKREAGEAAVIVRQALGLPSSLDDTHGVTNGCWF